MKQDESKLPASARSTTDENGRTADLHYTPGHLRKLIAMKKAGKRINLPAGINVDDYDDTGRPLDR